MSFSEAIAYQRDILAVKSRLLAAMMPCDRETSAAMQVVIVASQVGTNAARLAKQTELAIERVRAFAKRLRQAGIWKGNSADATEWLDISYDRQRMTIILAQALVARGFLKRRWTGNAAIYADENDNVVLRCCPFESFIDCLDALLHLESRSQQALAIRTPPVTQHLSGLKSDL
jgi:hypothetical protein